MVLPHLNPGKVVGVTKDLAQAKKSAHTNPDFWKTVYGYEIPDDCSYLDVKFARDKTATHVPSVCVLSLNVK